jgi:hypothetical protein
MRNIVKQILKEERELYQSRYIVVSEDEQWVSPYYKSGGNSNVFDSVQRFISNPDDYFHPTLHSAEVSLNLLSDRASSQHKPKIVKYNVGYFKDNEKMGDVFDQLKESEENEFDWVEGPSNEPFHHILMGKTPREPMLLDEVHTIMFNPPVSINGGKFKKVAYWLEDLDYFPDILRWEGYTSYIEITRNKHGSENGRYVVGPELSQEELYNLSQSTKKYSHGNWNGNFWYEEFANRFF